MAEIVRIKASGQVGIVRATYTDNATGEELVEVQLVGRAHGFNRFLKRSEYTLVDREDINNAIANIMLSTVNEIMDSAHDAYGQDVLVFLHSVRMLSVSLRGGGVEKC